MHASGQKLIWTDVELILWSSVGRKIAADVEYKAHRTSYEEKFEISMILCSLAWCLTFSRIPAMQQIHWFTESRIRPNKAKSEKNIRNKKERMNCVPKYFRLITSRNHNHAWFQPVVRKMLLILKSFVWPFLSQVSSEFSQPMVSTSQQAFFSSILR